MMRRRLLSLLLLPLAVCALDAQTLSPAFIENNGQWPADVRYRLQLDGLTMWITDRGAIYDLHEVVAPTMPLIAPLDATDDPSMSIRDELRRVRGHVLRAEFVDASPQVEAIGGEAMGGRFNYLIGNDRSRWGRNCRAFASVRLSDVYDGIDVVYYLDEGMPRYDLIVAPGSDVAQVRMTIDGADDLRVVNGGRIAVGTSLGDLEMRELLTYQRNEKGERCQVSSRFVVDGGVITYAVGAYDRSRPLVVDPLIFSTFLGGGASDWVTTMVVGDDGAIHVGGFTTDGVDFFPVTPGAYDTSANNLRDGYVAKLSADGSRLIYATLLGSDMDDRVMDMVLNDQGNPIITGSAEVDGEGKEFPTTSGVYDETFNGLYDAFVAALSPDGSDLRFSTFLGGSWGDAGSSLALDTDGTIVVMGACGAAAGSGAGRGEDDFPTTPGAYGRSSNGSWDIFVARLTSDGASLLMSTFLGGSNVDQGRALALGPTGEIYLTGTTRKGNFPFPTPPGALRKTYAGSMDGFLARLSADGSQLLAATLIGGRGDDDVVDLVVDRDGNAYLGGYVHETTDDFPTTEGAYDRSVDGVTDIVIAKIGPDCDTLLFSTFLGGAAADQLGALTLSPDGALYLLGHSGDVPLNDYPITPDAYDDSYDSLNRSSDLVLSVMSPDGRRIHYGTYFGGRGDESAVAIVVRAGNIYVAGQTEGIGAQFDALFPVTPGAYDVTPSNSRDLFVASFALTLSDVPIPISPIPYRLDLR